ncbi:SHOCT domain-containing protein [Priestia sp. YIM B13486]
MKFKSIDELSKLVEFKEQGILTEEEFQEQKRNLLTS